MHHHHRSSSGVGIPAPPPPPVITSRTSRGPGSRQSGRSRSRSRSPGGMNRISGSRYPSRSERDLRDRHEPRDRERDRGRRSPSPYNSSNRAVSDRDRDRKHPSSSSSTASKGSLQQQSSAVGLEVLPSISLIQTDTAPTIIRRILNPEDVKIPRRVGEGSRPVFDRDELREAMLRRMRSNDNEENPPQPNSYIQEPTATQQRVVAIIREPAGGADIYLGSKDPTFHHTVKLSTSSVAAHLPPISPDTIRSSVYHRRPSPPPSPSRNVRHGRHSSPPPPPQLSSSVRPSSRSNERDRERDRLLEVEREQIQRALERERTEQARSGRDRDLIAERLDRADHLRDREKRFGGPELEHRPRTRSPVARIPRDDLRLRRRSRSHSVTPPPMPEEIRRQFIERQRHVDLRSSLSRQPGKYMSPHDDRSRGRGGVPIRGIGGGRGRGGFPGRGGRGGRAREDGRLWVHDMYDGDDEPKKGN